MFKDFTKYEVYEDGHMELFKKKVLKTSNKP